MSRVHDALKKAEQEKAMAGDADSSVERKLPAEEDRRYLETTRLASRVRLDEGAESRFRQDELAAEAFLDRCSRREWTAEAPPSPSPDTRRQTLVFEEFRSLRSRLYLMRKVRPLQKLVVTSPLPREGKTFVTSNLARVMAKQADSRVLVVDGDLRMCTLHATLGAPAGPGLTEYLAGGLELASIIQRGPTDNLFFIPGGDTTPNPTELISNGRLELLLKRVAPIFDWIIIDSPPVVPVSDAKLLAGLCDGVMMLVNAGTTPFDLAQKACGEFSREQILGVILNRVYHTHTYGSYYHYSERYYHRGDDKGATA